MSSSSSSAPPPAERACDPVVGLDVGGQVYYCRRSTLLNGGEPSYFSARFDPDGTLGPPEADHVDARGREVYFIDRDPELFGLVLNYLRMGKLPARIGSFQENPNLWRALRAEADFFALEGLVALLRATFSCSPDVDGDKGILYYLGTNKGREEYVNPFTRKMIDVTGEMDAVDSHADLSLEDLPIVLGTQTAREQFVQHRLTSTKEVKVDGISHVPDIGDCETLLDHAEERWPVIVDLRNNLVSPTHYSLRHGGCYGMDGKWNFEASVDGVEWSLLHAGNEDVAGNLSRRTRRDRISRNELKMFEDMLEGYDEEEKRKAHCDYMERHYRQTWEVEHSGEYYRYFRIIGADTEDDDGSDTEDDDGCLYCAGLEIYGSIYEE